MLNNEFNKVWWQTTLILGLERQRLVGIYKFQANLDYIKR